MKKIVHIEARWDEDWWVALSEDIEGFATQARTLDELPALAQDIAQLADDVPNPEEVEFFIEAVYPGATFRMWEVAS